MKAKDVTGHEFGPVGVYYSAGSLTGPTCEVVLSYIHPGTNSSQVEVRVWLPEKWNERFLGTGGGGWQCSMGPTSMLRPSNEGYATAQTNGGLAGLPFDSKYSLLSPGNPNKAAIEMLGHRAIHEMTVLAKSVVELYYGRAARTNIYVGCSTGGRQGLMEASRYPHDYDGIVAGAPAVRWNHLVVGILAGQAIMSETGYFPSQCELLAINEAAIEACDELDGLVDGYITRSDLCKFHASSAVGRPYQDECDGQGGEAKVTAAGAKIMQQLIEGIYASDGEKVVPGFAWGTAIWSPTGLGRTIVDEVTGQRTFHPFALSRQWTEDLVLHGVQSLDFPRLTVDDIQALARRSALEYGYAMEPQPDMTAFRLRGGKILTHHGVEDELVPMYNTLQRYAEVQEAMFPRDTVTEGVAKMHDFWRLFLLPGVQHCAPYPGKLGAKNLDAYKLVTRWVEEGIAPDRFVGLDVTPTYDKACLWPSKPFWREGNLECQSGVSAWDAMPSAPEMLNRFIERLPSMLFLNPKPEL